MLKRFAEYSNDKESGRLVEEDLQEVQTEVEEEKTEDIEIDEDEVDKDDEEEENDKEEENEKDEEELKEDVVINDPFEEKDKTLNITVKVDGKIATFSEGMVKDIYTYISEKIKDISFFIRKQDEQIHVVKYNENLDINVNRLVDELFRHYSKNEGIKNIVSNIKIKGNNKFSIIENINNKFSDKVIIDLSKILNNSK